METTLDSLLTRTAESFPDKPALVCGQNTITFRTLRESVDDLTRVFINLTIGREMKVALLLKDSIEYVQCLFAVNRIGAVNVPINTRLKIEEINLLLKQSGSHALIYDSTFSHLIDKIRQKNRIQHFLNISEFVKGHSRHGSANDISKNQSLLNPREDDPATLLFTSGTTSSKQKAAVLTNRNHLWACQTLKIDYGITSEDILLTSTPLFHTSGLHRCIGAVAFGCTHILMAKFDPRRLLSLIQQLKVTYTFLVPTMFAMIEQEASATEYDTSSLRLLFTGAARAHPEIFTKMQAFFPKAEICMSYGCTESFTAAIIRAADMTRKWGSIGKPVSTTELRLCNDKGLTLSKGEIGEIWIKGRSVAQCYYSDPVATKEAFENGWFKTGDLAKWDDDGFLYLVDRKKDIIISGAENISSMEVEDVLYRNEKVLEAAVIGVPDHLWGESVRALVVKKPKTNLTEKELIDFCGKRLAGYKRPKSVVFLNCLPKNESNKTLKRDLKERFGQQQAGATASGAPWAPP